MIPNSGLEIKNRCTQKDVSGEKLTSIPKSGPEIKNRCTKEGVNRQNLASILKSRPEIKNRCIGGGGGVLQAKPFSFAATKIRIGGETRCCHGRCRRNHSPSRRRRLESDAEDRSRYGRSRRAIPILCEARLSKAMPQLFKGGDWRGGEPY